MSATSTSFNNHGQTQGHNVIQGLTLSGGTNKINFTTQTQIAPVPEEQKGNVHWRVPRKTNSLFTGRTKLIERIKSEIRNGEPDDRFFVITGLGGLGKSELCLKIAKEMREEFWGVFWIEVSSPSIATADFIAVANILGKEANNIEDSLMLLSNINKPCLLILDNADDLNFDYHVYLPSAMKGSVILTSRVADCKQLSTIGWEPLTSMDKEDCRELLLRAANVHKDRWQEHMEAADNVIRLLESHTLAIIQAGAYITPNIYQMTKRPLFSAGFWGYYR